MNISSIWRKILKIMNTVPALVCFAFLSYFEVYVLVATVFFEIVKSIAFGQSFAYLALLAITIGVTLFFGVGLYLKIYQKSANVNSLAVFCSEISVIVALVLTGCVAVAVGNFEPQNYLRALPYFLMGAAVIAFLYLIPLAKKKTFLGMVAVCVAVAIIGTVAVFSVKIAPFGFVAAPAVFDNGTDFSVVWCTTSESVGYLEYTYNGQKYRVEDASDGKYNADKRVHTVHVPYAHLYGNTYTVSSAQVIRNTPYTSKIGEYITSAQYTFANEIDSDRMSIVTASDWHEDTKSLISAVAACKKFDVLVMMGDPANYMDEYEDILNFVVIPGGKITGGVKPIVYVRGNHDVRGKYSNYLKEVLGFEKYYYVASYGHQNFFVFDGSEDKYDEHPEYGGLLVSEKYRAQQLTEMEAYDEMGGYNICLTHKRLYTISGDDEGYARFQAILEKQKIKFEISGHEHKLRFIDGENYDTLVDGGIESFNDGYSVCHITLSRGVAIIEAVSATGETNSDFPAVALR